MKIRPFVQGSIMLMASYANAADLNTDFLNGKFQNDNPNKYIEITREYPCSLYEFKPLIREQIEQEITSRLQKTPIQAQEWSIYSTKCNMSAFPEPSQEVLESAIEYYEYAVEYYNDSDLSKSLGVIPQREIIRVNNNDSDITDRDGSVYFANHFEKGRFATFRGAKTNHQIKINAQHSTNAAMYDGNRDTVYVSTAHPGVILHAPFSENLAEFFLEKFDSDIKEYGKQIAHMRLETITESLSHSILKEMLKEQDIPNKHTSIDIYTQNEIYEYVPQAVNWIENNSSEEAVSLYLEDSSKFMDAIKQ